MVDDSYEEVCANCSEDVPPVCSFPRLREIHTLVARTNEKGRKKESKAPPDAGNKRT
jgi:hypothetical protein